MRFPPMATRPRWRCRCGALMRSFRLVVAPIPREARLGNVFRLFFSLVVAAIFVAFTQVPAGAFIICSSLLGNCPAGYTDDPVPMKPAITKDSINGVLMGPGFWDPMTFKLAVALSQMQIIYAVGDIGVDTPGKFAGFLKANNIKPGALVVFNSPGGNPSAGMLIGRIIRRDSLRTSIGKERTNSTSLLSASLQPGICASSCSLAFLGGVERTVPHGSLYGVHDISKPVISMYEWRANPVRRAFEDRFCRRGRMTPCGPVATPP